MGYLIGEVEQLSKDDPSFIKWKSVNSFVTAWLMNSMEPAAKQGNQDVTAYYNLMMTLWQELDQCYDDVTIYYNSNGDSGSVQWYGGPEAVGSNARSLLRGKVFTTKGMQVLEDVDKETMDSPIGIMD
ncbi:hypothetical protein CR513_22599, partial [Mucuna pruriens]